MKIVIFGATGTLGSVVTEQALARGHQVTALSRKPAETNLTHPMLNIIEGDVLDKATVTRTVAGHDAVICTLGAGRQGQLRHLGTRNIISAMHTTGVMRLICQTTLGAGDSIGQLNFFWRYIMFGLFLRAVLRDHQAQEDEVFKSNLKWTIVRPAAFTDGPITGQYQHGFSEQSVKLKLKISRQDLAQFMLDQLKSEFYCNRTAAISY